MSDAEFFLGAKARPDEIEAESLTDQIDQAVAMLRGRDDVGEQAVAAGRRVVEATPEW